MYRVDALKREKTSYYENLQPAALKSPPEKKNPGLEEWAEWFVCDRVIVSVALVPVKVTADAVPVGSEVGFALLVMPMCSGETRKAEYTRWRKLVIKDEFQNEYKQIRMTSEAGLVDLSGETTRIDGRENSVVDLLVFERPVKKATQFTLDLSGDNLGFQSPIRVKFTRDTLDAVERVDTRPVVKK